MCVRVLGVCVCVWCVCAHHTRNVAVDQPSGQVCGHELQGL